MAQYDATFEGREVKGIKAIVRKTGDGLSAAQEVEPVEVHVGDRVFVIAELACRKIRFDDVPAEYDEDGDEVTSAALMRVQDFDSLGMMIVTDPDVERDIAVLLGEMGSRVRSKRELEKNGQQSFDDPDDPALTSEELGVLSLDLDEIGVTSDQKDRRQWIESVLDESPLRLRQSHLATLRDEIERVKAADAEEILEIDVAERQMDPDPV